MKRHITYIVLLVLLIILGIWSCERDDICAEATETTPHLIIRFYDLGEPDELKAVRQLSARGIDAEGNPLDVNIPISQPFDSIVLPLRFQAEGIPTISEFSIEKDTDFRLDTLAATNSNIDIIKVTYTPQFVYVSKACGYKSIFNNISITVEPDSNIWILGREIINTTIENENQAHIIFRH